MTPLGSPRDETAAALPPPIGARGAADPAAMEQALAALARQIACRDRDAGIEAALLAADRDGVDPYTRVRLRNAYVWQRHLDGDTRTPILLLARTVAELRGRGDRAEGLALCGLAAGYSNQERTCEAILAASASARVFDANRAPDEATRARILLAGSLIAFEAWPLVDRVAVPITAVLPTLPRAFAEWSRKHLHMYAMDRLVAGEGGFAALLAIDALEAFLGPDARSDEFASVLPLNRAVVFDRAGLREIAERHLEIAFAAEPRMPQIRSQLHLIRARCRAARGDLAGSREDAVATIDALRGDRPDSSLSRLRQAAAAVGSLFLNEYGDPAGAEAWFDLASSAVVARLREIDQAFSDRPELRDATPEDFALLGEAREFAERATSRDLAVIRRAFERHASGGDDLLARLSRHAGPRALCAWCGAVRTTTDRWLPIAEHLPPPGDDVTHGICPRCRSRMESELDSAAK